MVALFERAVEADRNHAGALFGLALENDRRGNDEMALDLYERSAYQFPSHVGPLLNLGILYEDRQQYDKAQQCYQRILEIFPTNNRARLFLKDAAGLGRHVLRRRRPEAPRPDEPGAERPGERFRAVGPQPQLPAKDGHPTLGDLARCTEQDLLASKNFGETSLVEIRDMLASKGLALGQLATEKASRAGLRARVR